MEMLEVTQSVKKRGEKERGERDRICGLRIVMKLP